MHDHPNMLVFTYLMEGTINLDQMKKTDEKTWVRTGTEIL